MVGIISIKTCNGDEKDKMLWSGVEMKKQPVIVM